MNRTWTRIILSVLLLGLMVPPAVTVAAAAPTPPDVMTASAGASRQAAHSALATPEPAPPNIDSVPHGGRPGPLTPGAGTDAGVAGTPAIPESAPRAAGSPAAANAPTGRPGEASSGAPGAFGTFTIGRDTDVAGGGSLISEPSTATDPWCGGLYTYNWNAATTMDCGETWTFRSPYSMFPATWGGFCCDQTSIYDPSRDITIWILQYNPDGANNNGLRLAVARGHTSLIYASFYYWDITPQQAGAPNGTNFDQPKIALSDNYLYMTAARYGAAGGSEVMRFPLQTLRDAGTLGYNVYFPLFSPGFTQGAHATMYFAAHVSTSTLRVYSWPEAGGVSFNDVNHSSYPLNLPMRCPRTGGSATSDYCQRRSFGGGWAHDDRIFAGWVSNGVIGFMWDASQGSGGLGNFAYPYIHAVRINEGTKALINQPIMWSGSTAFTWVSASTNVFGEIAGTVIYGGGNQYENSLAWIYDAFSPNPPPGWEVYYLQTSDIDPSDTLGGDYTTTRLNGSNNRNYSASTYNLRNNGFGGVNVHEHFYWFGREGDMPRLGYSPNGLNFGNVRTGTSSYMNITVNNPGPVNVYVVSATLGGLDASQFATTFDNCSGVTIGVGGNCTVQIRFSPNSMGFKSANLAVRSSGIGSPQVLGLTGNGVAPLAQVTPASINFGNQLAGTASGPQTTTIQNVGTDTMAVNSIVASAGFTITGGTCPATPFSLAVNASCTKDVAFSPSAAGPYNGSISYFDDATGSPHSTALSGNGVDPAGVSPTSIDFGHVVVGATSPPQTVTVTNNGTVDLNVLLVSVDGAFAPDYIESDDCVGVPIAAGSFCTITLQFAPTAAGPEPVQVTIQTDAYTGTHVVQVTGIGDIP